MVFFWPQEFWRQHWGCIDYECIAFATSEDTTIATLLVRSHWGCNDYKSQQRQVMKGVARSRVAIWSWVALHCSVLQCVALFCVAMCCIALHWIAMAIDSWEGCAVGWWRRGGASSPPFNQTSFARDLVLQWSALQIALQEVAMDLQWQMSGGEPKGGGKGVMPDWETFPNIGFF